MGGKMSHLVPGLYVGSIKNAQDEEDLANNKISHVLSIFHLDALKKQALLEHLESSRLEGQDSLTTRSSTVTVKPKDSNRTYLKINAHDTPGQNISGYFTKSSHFIHGARQEGGACLVHCMMGVSRSVTLCVAYLTTITGLPCQQVLDSVRGRRHVANPNEGFQKQLMEWYQSGGPVKDRDDLVHKFGPWAHLDEDLKFLNIGLEDFNTPRIRRNINLPSETSDPPAAEKKGSVSYIIPHTDYKNFLRSDPRNVKVVDESKEDANSVPSTSSANGDGVPNYEVVVAHDSTPDDNVLVMHDSAPGCAKDNADSSSPRGNYEVVGAHDATPNAKALLLDDIASGCGGKDDSSSPRGNYEVVVAHDCTPTSN